MVAKVSPGPGLADQLLDFSISGGLNDANDAINDDVILLQDATDCITLKDKSITRRNGYNSSSGSAGSFANSIFQRDNRPYVYCESGIIARPTDDTTFLKALNTSSPRPCDVTENAEVRKSINTYNPECTTKSGLLCTVWSNTHCFQSDMLPVSASGTTGVYARITDEETGAIVLETQITDFGFNPRVVTLGRYFVITAVTDLHDIDLWYFDTETPSGAWLGPSPIGNATETYGYDVGVMSNPGANTMMFVARFNATSVILTKITSGFSVSNITTALADVKAVSVTHCPVTDRVYTAVFSNVAGGVPGTIAAYYTAATLFTGFTICTNLYPLGYSGAYGTSYATPRKERVVIAQDNYATGSLVIGWSWACPRGANGDPTYAPYTTISYITETANLSPTGTYVADSMASSPGYELASKPILIAPETETGQTVLLLKHADSPAAQLTESWSYYTNVTLQSSALLVCRALTGTGTYSYSHVPVARLFDAGLMDFPFYTLDIRYSTPNLVRSSIGNSDTMLVPGNVFTRAPINFIISPTTSGINIAKVVRRGSIKPQRWINAAGSVYTHGGIQTVCDGVKGYENSIHHYPEKPWTQVGAAGPGATGWYTTAASNHNIVIGWVYWDNDGLEHRSGISLPCTTGTAADPNKYPILFVPPPPPSAVGNLTLRIYATGDLNASASPDAYYLQAEVEASELVHCAAGETWLYYNALSQFTDEGSELVYTSGGVLESLAPPALKDICTWQDVLVGISAEDRNLLYYTKPFQPGIAPEWNPALTIRIPSEGGDVVSINALDDKLVCLKENAVYYAVGSTRDALGQGNDPTVVRVASDVGCVGRHTTAIVPDGLLFVANHGRGLVLLDRGMTTHRLRAAEDRFVNLDQMHSTLVVPYESSVRWGWIDGTALCLNYDQGSFSRFTNYFGNTHHAVIDGRTWALNNYQNDYNLFQENDPSTEGVDFQAPYWTINTAWFKLGGINGFQRLKRLLLAATPGSYGTNLGVTLKVSAWVNYQDEGDPVYEATWPNTAFGTALKQLELHVPVQKCGSVRFQIEEVAVSPPPVEASLYPITLSQLSLRIGVKRAQNRIGSGSRTPVGAAGTSSSNGDVTGGGLPPAPHD